MVDTADLFDRLRLARTRRIGPVTYAQLLARFGSAAAAISALPDLAQRHGGKPITLAKADDVEREIAAVTRLGARHIMAGDADYPVLLAELGNAPVALIIKGEGALLHRPSVAMVGARNASAAAVRFARMLSAGLAAAGQIIVSGLARGIDTAAHQGAIGHGARSTIGVIASGIDIAFPRENARLQDEIAEQHLLVSEYPPGTEPLARQFPHRNRIIAGLSSGTIVVEAAPKSGSLLTARMAAEAGRDVMAVPGSPLDPRAQGCNGLIREGATLIQTVDDVFEAISAIDARMAAMARDHSSARRIAIAPQPISEPGEAETRAVTALLGPVAVTIDELVRQSGLASHQVQSILVELEIAGKVEHHAGGRVALCL